jgi:hypothetical protein
MTPVSLAQAIPVKIRNIIYSVLAAAFAVEAALDLFGYGLVNEQPQAAAFAVLGALGFSIAQANTNTGGTP